MPKVPKGKRRVGNTPVAKNLDSILNNFPEEDDFAQNVIKVSNRSGIGAVSIRDWCNGNRNPSKELLPKVVRAICEMGLHITEDELREDPSLSPEEKEISRKRAVIKRTVDKVDSIQGLDVIQHIIKTFTPKEDEDINGSDNL